MTGQPTGAGPVVSVVVAAYQVERWIGRFLDSVLAQTLDPAAVELVVVDDGSTDGTGALLDAFAADRPGVVVVHQANSGGPGGPRNTGVRLSRGEFLFFADPDDVLAPDGLELLVAAARRNDADVVLGRLVGVGRSAPRAPFAADVERGDVWSTRAVWSLSAQKLFRRDLVVENGLRFVEGLRYAEDQEFVLAAYLAARAISVVASRACYYLVLREDAGNATRTVADPATLYGVVDRAIGLVEARVPPGPRRDDLLERFLAVEVLVKVLGHNLLGMTPEQQQAYVDRARPLMPRFSAPLVARLPALDRVRAALLAAGDLAGLLALARFEVTQRRPEPLVEDGQVLARYPLLREGAVPDEAYDITDELALDHCVEEVRWDGDRLTVRWTPYAPALRAEDLQWSLAVRARGTPGAALRVPAVADGARRTAVVELGAAAREGRLPDDTWDLTAQVRSSTTWRGKPVGSAGTILEMPRPSAHLVDGRLVALRRTWRSTVLLDVATTGGRLRPVVEQVSVAQGQLALVGAVGVAVPADTSAWAAVLEWRARGGSATRTSPAHLHPGAREWRFTAELDVRDLPVGTWDAVLRLSRSDVEHEGVLASHVPDVVGAAAVGRWAEAYRTRRGRCAVAVHPLAPRLRLTGRDVRWQGGALLLDGPVALVAPPGVVGRLALVLREEASGREVELSLGALPAARALDAALDPGHLVRRRGLARGRWLVDLRADVEGVVLHLPLPATRRLPRGRRWLRAGLLRTVGVRVVHAGPVGGQAAGLMLDVRVRGPRARAGRLARQVVRRLRLS